MITTSIVPLLVVCVAGEQRQVERPTPAPHFDADWKQMQHTNPYPDICSEEIYDTKIELKLCILEHLWIDEMPTEMPRMSPGHYNFGPNSSHVFPRRRVSSSRHDCLVHRRSQPADVPYSCYRPIREDNRTYFNPFFNELFRELRFTFDFVLHEDPQLYIENNFWFLILYLRKIAMELTSPFELLKVLSSSEERKEDAKAKLADLENQVKSLKYQSADVVVELQRNTEELAKNIQTILGNKRRK